MMNSERMTGFLRYLRHLLMPALVISAFLLGGWILGADDSKLAPAHDHQSSSDQAQTELWTCSMHPQIRADEPGLCPICGMELIPVDQNAGPALNEIALSESAKIRAKIQTTVVRPLGAEGVERRLLGRVDYDETRLRTVTSWIDGRIDRLSIKTTGQVVNRGQVIATLYSPEVFSAHQDLLVAQEQVKRLSGASDIARASAEAALAASRDRLRLLGISGPALQAMETANRPSEQIEIRSPFTGTVIERLATQGSYVKTGSGLFQIADLTQLWVQLDAYESDLPLLSVGQLVDLRVEALPGESFQGRVTFVDPVLNQRTRTTRVRIEVGNAQGRLRPGMFAEAVVRANEDVSKESSLVIPESAPLFTGRRSLVYVEVPHAKSPTYSARVVKLGPKTGEFYPVLSGLAVGERVVTHGAFTLDADLQIRGGLSMMSMADENAALEHTVPLPHEHKEALASVVLAYLGLHESLASDDLVAAKAASLRLVESAKALHPAAPEDFRDAWAPLARHLIRHGQDLVAAASIEDARASFRDLSQQIATILRVFGNPSGETVRLAFCPMALDGEGAEWVQRSTDIENPYFGSSMHTCGDIHESVEHGTFLPLEAETRTLPAAPAVEGHQH